MFFVRYCRGDRQFQLRARTYFAPKLQACTDFLCALAYSAYTPVSGLRAGLQNLGVDSLAIIPDTQSKLILIVLDFHLDVTGSGVQKRISDCLAGNLVDLFLKRQRQILFPSFDDYL